MSTARLNKKLDKKKSRKTTTEHIDEAGDIVAEHRQAPKSKKQTRNEMLETIEKEINSLAIEKITTAEEQKKLLEDFNKLKDFCRHPNKNSHVIDIATQSLETTLAEIRVRKRKEKLREEIDEVEKKNLPSVEKLVAQTNQLQKDGAVFKSHQEPAPSRFSRLVACLFPCCASKEEEGTKEEKAPLLGYRK